MFSLCSRNDIIPHLLLKDTVDTDMFHLRLTTSLSVNKHKQQDTVNNCTHDQLSTTIASFSLRRH